MADQNSERPSKISLKNFQKAGRDAKFIAKHAKTFRQLASK